MFFKTIFLALFLLNHASAQLLKSDSADIYIAEIEISTDGEIASLPLFKKLVLKKNSSYSPENLLKTLTLDSVGILALAREEGFHFAELSVEKSGENSFKTIRFILHEKKQVRFGEIRVPNVFDQLPDVSAHIV